MKDNKGGDMAKGAEVVFDPNSELDVKKQTVNFDEDGSFSDDGSNWAYAIGSAGSDWKTVKVRSLKNMKDYKDELKWVKFSGIEWTSDSKGFFYSRYDAPKDETADQAGSGTQALESPKLMYHRVDTEQSEDSLMYKNEQEPNEAASI